MDKPSLRKIYLGRRQSLGAAERTVLNQEILNNFKKLDLSAIRFIHLFYPIAGKNEPDSLQLVSWLRLTHPEIQLVLSKSNLVDHSLSHLLWTEKTPLSGNKWGITEPETGPLVAENQLDMILIPLLAYDGRGNRVGYGKGFYDRFLANCRPNALKVGISWFPPEEELITHNEHDIPLDACVSPQQIYHF